MTLRISIPSGTINGGRSKELLCPGCNQAVKNLPLRSFYSKVVLQEYRLYHCKECDLMFWEPLELMSDLYENESFGSYYFYLHYSLNRELRPRHRTFFNNAPLKRGLLLDIGGANGLFALEAQRRGFEVYLIDFDKKSIEAARKNGIDNAFSVSLKVFVNYCKEKNLLFDVVTFFEVLEHQDDLEEFITNIKTILKPSGFIAGSTTNRDRMIVKLCGYRETWDFPPHHFFWWNEKSLKNLFHRYNFTLELFFVQFRLYDATACLVDFMMDLPINWIKRMAIGKKDARGALETKTIDGSQKIVLLVMKHLRHFCLLPLGLFIKIIHVMKGDFYFQCQLSKHR